MKELTTNEYELAYHLLPDLEASAAEGRAREIESIITSAGGTLISARELKRIHLSYPLLHKHYSLFGICRFNAPTNALHAIENQLKLQKDIMRHLITKDELAGSEKRILGEHKASARARATHTASTPDEGKAKVTGEQIEKELTEVIEKL